jgi:hypothetical protein
MGRIERQLKFASTVSELIAAARPARPRDATSRWHREVRATLVRWSLTW